MGDGPDTPGRSAPPRGALRSLAGRARALIRTARESLGALEDDRQSHFSSSGSADVGLRGVHLPGGRNAVRQVEASFAQHPGVLTAEVNAALGRVLVRYDASTLTRTDLLALVESSERNAGLENQPFRDARHPGDEMAAPRELAQAGAYFAGAAAAVLGRATRAPSLPPAVATLVSVAEGAPPLRALRTSPAGRFVTGAVSGWTLLVTQSLAQLPTSLLVEGVHRLALAAEARGQQAAWARLQARFEEAPGSYRNGPLTVDPRPMPLPDGPVEHYANRAFSSSLASSALLGGLTRSRSRAFGALACGATRSSRLGREAFLSQLGRILARHDAIVMDQAALTRMDRIDTVVLDSSTLLTGDRAIEEVVRLGEGPAHEELLLRALAMVDLRDTAHVEHDGDWTVTRLQRETVLTVEARRTAREWRHRGDQVCVLARGNEPVALIDIAQDVDPLADALVRAAKSSATVVIAGKHSGLAARLDVEAALPGGSQLAASVRGLQEAGHAVALVSARNGAALAAADLGIAVPLDEASVPWGAHVICMRGATEAFLILQGLSLARQVSRRSVVVTATAASVAMFLAMVASPTAMERRVLTVLGMAAIANLSLGTWSMLVLGGRPPPVPAERTPWHAMPPDVALRLLDSSPDGLDEAEAARRLQERDSGYQPRSGIVRASTEDLANPVTAALAVSAGVSATVGSVLDAVLITGVLAVNALIGGAQRVGTDRALHHLVDASAVRVRLRRGGHSAEVTAEDLVPGDIVQLHAGDAVPADCRILVAENVEVDESTLTGESQPVPKAAAAAPSAVVAERSSMLYEGTSIAAGTCRAVVVATGAGTELGRTVRAAAHAPAADGVEARLRGLTRLTLPVSVTSGVVLLAVTMLRGRQLSAALGPAVNLAVAAIPEGLPFVATIAELAAARRVSAQGGLVRRPSTMEALGRIDVLCFDKTGTLTEGRISLKLVADADHEATVDGGLDDQLRGVLAAALRASPDGAEANLVPHPTDRGVLAGGRALGVGPEDDADSWQRLTELPFEPGRGYHAVVGGSSSGAKLTVKGAPEVVLDRCTSTGPTDGPTRALGGDDRDRLARRAHDLALAGYRVLAVAERAADGLETLDDAAVRDLRFRGFVGLADAIRPTAAAAVQGLQAAGVDVVMVTGDHPGTAEAIAGELDALTGRRILTGPELDAMDDADLADVLPTVGVFARVTPSHKSRIVDGLRRGGRTVAVTGDGANDAAAIRLADVGIALGSNATAAAREAADIVITDDRIETIVAAILEGRAMWASVRDALAILLGGNLGEIAFTLGTVLLANDQGLTTRQLLLVNMLTDVLPATAVALRPPPTLSPEALAAEGPQSSLAGSLNHQIGLRAAATAFAAGAAWGVARMTGTAARARTVGLVALVSAQLLQTLAMGTRSGLVVGAVVISLAALAVIVSVPGLSGFFGCQPIGPMGWGIAICAAMLATALAALLPRLLAATSAFEQRPVGPMESEPQPLVATQS